MGLSDKQLYAIANFRLREQMGIPRNVDISFTMLGQGEYNVNYLFTHPVTGRQLVLRYNTGSQMGLADQIGYEFYALQLLRHSGRTPQPYYLDSQRRLLVMEYLPGRPLDYRTDLALAAACLADIHAVPVPDGCRLLCPADPLQAMLEECRRMAGVYLQSNKADKSVKQRLVRLLGAAGLPVFSGFGAGVGALLGPTGGYILGFAFTALSMWGVEAKFGEALPARIAGMALGLALCYAFGTAWFMAVYARTNGPIALGAALSMCVFPFILPDIAKMALAILLSARLKPLLRRR